MALGMFGLGALGFIKRRRGKNLKKEYSKFDRAARQSRPFLFRLLPRSAVPTKKTPACFHRRVCGRLSSSISQAFYKGEKEKGVSDKDYRPLSR